MWKCRFFLNVKRKNTVDTYGCYFIIISEFIDYLFKLSLFRIRHILIIRFSNHIIDLLANISYNPFRNRGRTYGKLYWAYLIYFNGNAASVLGTLLY